MRYFFAVLLIVATLCRYSYALDTIRVDEKSSLFSALDTTFPVVTTSYIGWSKNWRWAETRIQPVYHHGDSRSAFTGNIPDLGIDFSGTLKAGPHAGQFVWDYQWDRRKNVPNATGFGIEFRFDLTAPVFPSAAKPPELLPGNRGWRWQTPDGRRMTVEFAPPLAGLAFEGKQRNRVRALFFTAVEQGRQQSAMTVTMDETVRMSGPASLEYDRFEPGTWQRDVLPGDSSPVDLSFLNRRDRPAGRRGFVTARGADLVFADGTPARFWGVNLQAHALFSTRDENIRKHARRIAQSGFNLVRIHHHDSVWVRPNIFTAPDANTLTLSAESLRKLDLWIACLKEQGVYVWLDLHVGRSFTKNDGIINFAELAKGKDTSEIRGFNYYNTDIQARMQAFNAAYLSHVNQYTGKACKDDPVVVALLLTNENDLTHHFANALLGNKGVPQHNKLFSNDAKQFSKEHKLSFDRTLKTWEPGESRIYLNDVEHRFNLSMIAHLRRLGVKALIATTSSWGGMGLSGLPSLTDGDMVDVHSYGTAEELTRNPRYYAGFPAWIGAAQVAGKPLSVTEWNIEPFPAADRFTAPLYTAGIACLQGWDALMLYGYSQAPLNGDVGGSNYSSFNDPAIMGLMPAAALLYRQQHVAPAKNSYELAPDRNRFFFIRSDPASSKSIRTLLETSRFAVRMPETPELPWLKSSLHSARTATVIQDMDRDFISSGQSSVTSDTGELRRDWVKGIQTINTARSQIVAGSLGGEVIHLANATFAIRTRKAVVAVQSLDNRPLRKSGKIFITLMARSQPDSTKKTAFLSEPVTGRISFAAPKGLQLYPVTTSGKPGAPMDVSYASGRYTVDFSSSAGHWFIMK